MCLPIEQLSMYGTLNEIFCPGCGEKISRVPTTMNYYECEGNCGKLWKVSEIWQR